MESNNTRCVMISCAYTAQLCACVIRTQIWLASSTSGYGGRCQAVFKEPQKTADMSEYQRDRLGQWTFDEGTGDNVCPSTVRGLDHLRNPRLNKVSFHTFHATQTAQKQFGTLRSNTDVKNEWSCTSTYPICLDGIIGSSQWNCPP
jgi:hypothetical protein